MSIYELVPGSLHWLQHAVPFVGHPLSRGAKLAPFFLVGSGRSGNTLLRRVLYQHPDFHIPPENPALGHAIRLFRQNRNLRWHDLVCLVLAELEYHKDFAPFALDSLRPLASELFGVQREERCLALIIDQFYRYHARSKGRECVRWGDKTPINAFYLDELLRTFPDAQFVHVLRNGCDVVHSFLRAGLMDSVEDAATRWAKSVRRVRTFQRRHPGRVLEVRYEDLVASPDQSLRRICAFLEADFCEAMLEVSDQTLREMGDVMTYDHYGNVRKPIFTDSVGRGSRELSAEQLRVAIKLIGREMQLLGYPLPDQGE